MASCSGYKVSYDFPSGGKKYTGKTFTSKFGANEAKEPAIANVTPTPTQEVAKDKSEDAENWEVPNTPFYLKVLKAGDSAKVTTTAGAEVKFSVIEEYASASKKYCKKYLIEDSLNLACFNPHWKPVRIFE